MTVSMSALSKLSTMNRPRWADGTGGAVGGAAGSVGGAGGAAARGGSAGADSARGPTETAVGGTAGSTVVVTVGAGIGGIGGIGAVVPREVFAGPAQPLAKTSSTIAAIPR